MLEIVASQNMQNKNQNKTKQNQNSRIVMNVQAF